MSSQRIPQTSTTAGSSPHVKAALNRRIKGAQEQLRSKTSYNARQIQTLQQNNEMSKTVYADNAKSNTLQVDSKKQQRAEQVYQNINNLLEN